MSSGQMQSTWDGLTGGRFRTTALRRGALLFLMTTMGCSHAGGKRGVPAATSESSAAGKYDEFHRWAPIHCPRQLNRGARTRCNPRCNVAGGDFRFDACAPQCRICFSAMNPGGV